MRRSSALVRCSLFAFAVFLAVRALDAQPCPALNIKLDMPIAGFGSYEMWSGGSQSNLIARYSRPAFMGGVAANNIYSAALTPPVYGYDPVFNITLPWQGGCYTVNFIPQYRAVIADIGDDTNLPLHTILAEQVCRNDATTPPQVVAALDGTFTNSLLYTGLALTCNAYNITTVTTLYNDLAFTNKAYYPYSARSSLRLDAPNLLLFNLMAQFGWTRASVISVTSPDIVGLVNILQSEAATNNVDLQLLFQSPGGGAGSCSSNIDEAVLPPQDGRILFFLGDFADLVPCLIEVLATRQLQLQNYVVVLSFSTYSSGGFSMPTFAANLNLTAHDLQGIFTLTPVLTSTAFGAVCVKQMGMAEVSLHMDTKAINIVNPPFLTMWDAVTLISQGVYGMLGSRLKTALPALLAGALAQQTPTPGNTPAQNAQQVVQALLAAVSLTGTFAPATGYTFAETADNMTSNVYVPFASMRYQTEDVFKFFSNSTGTSLNASAMGHLIHDNNGEALVKIGIFNYDGQYLWNMGFYDMVFAKFSLSNSSVVWPNPSLLTSGINNNVPTDRAPTTSIKLDCPQCITPLRNIDPASTLFGQLPFVAVAYELDVAQDNPQVFSINPTCDGTAPVTMSLKPLVAHLTSESDANAPILAQTTLGTVSVYSSNLMVALKNMYDTSPTTFLQDGSLAHIKSFAELTTVINPQSIVSVVNGADGGFNVEILINCNNMASNVSAVLRIAIEPLPDIYTPPIAAQDALIALNSFGLGLTSFLIFAVVKHRDERAIFSSSFMFLLVILIGFLFLFVSSLLTILPATQMICQAKMITFHLGYTIALGSIFVKNYRLHRIFNSKNLLNMTISNRTLLTAVCGLLMVDIVVIVSWIQISGFDIESPSRAHCYTAGVAASVFPGIFSLLKGLILMSGIYLTFKVRAVPANFNESRFIAVVIYNTAVLSIVYIVVFFAFNIQPNSLSIFTSVICWLGAFVNMVSFYAPKLLALKNLYLKNDSSSGSTRSSRGKKHSKEKDRDRDRDREREKGLGTNNTSTLSQMDPDPITEEKLGSEQPTARGSGNNIQVTVEPGDPNSGKEKHRTVDSVNKRLKSLKGKYLSAVISAKRSNAEHNRLLLRADEVRRLADDFYDELRVLVMDIRLNCERLKKMITTAGAGSEEVQEHLVSIKDMIRLIELPIDRIQCDESTQTYTVMDSARGNSRRTQMHMTSLGSNVTVNNSTATTGNNTNPNIQMGNFNTLKREQGSLAKSPTLRGMAPSPSMHHATISGGAATSAVTGASPSPQLGPALLPSGGSSSNVIMIERDGIPVPLLPLAQTSSMNQPLSANDLSVTRSFTPRSGRDGRDTAKDSIAGESFGAGEKTSMVAITAASTPVLAPGNGSPVMSNAILGGAAARASVRRNVI